MTTLLLDTHTVFWFWWDDPRLSPAAKALICDPANRKLVSPATPWDLHLPPHADQRSQQLMDRNTNGALTPAERSELVSLSRGRSDTLKVFHTRRAS